MFFRLRLYAVVAATPTWVVACPGCGCGLRSSAGSRSRRGHGVGADGVPQSARPGTPGAARSRALVPTAIAYLVNSILCSRLPPFPALVAAAKCARTGGACIPLPNLAPAVRRPPPSVPFHLNIINESRPGNSSTDPGRRTNFLFKFPSPCFLFLPFYSFLHPPDGSPDINQAVTNLSSLCARAPPTQTIRSVHLRRRFVPLSFLSCSSSQQVPQPCHSYPSGLTMIVGTDSTIQTVPKPTPRRRKFVLLSSPL